MSMWRGFVAFFRFSHREAAGIKVLFFLILLAWLSPLTYRLILPGAEEIPVDFLAALERQEVSPQDNKQRASVGVEVTLTPEKEEEVVYGEFDPNTLDVAGWVRLGFSERQAQVIDNYRSKGGRFYNKEDLRKLYVVSETDYDRIADYVVIPPKNEGRQTADRVLIERSAFLQDQPPTIPSMELNTVDSFRLQLLPGIGPAFASRIVRYRDRLGGFHDVAQLLEVYGMDSARWAGLLEYVVVDRQQMHGLRINELDQETLGRHPLIGFKLASIIVRYREHHGDFADTEALKSLGVIDEDNWSKLLPYLQF
ncbi:MAG TPA: helix-hairpin-helix domain-containing protein [Sphingobacteriaceae bacterium]|nr:helix-hairpin-helix domain-containing protein [Sphingobacteriaceae bacterium]